MGRLFDAIASLIDIRQTASFEGQAAMELEALAEGIDDASAYPFDVIGAENDGVMRLDWRPMIGSIIRDTAGGKLSGQIAAAFHKTLVEMIGKIVERSGMKQVTLSGGCFQNKILLEGTIGKVKELGVTPFWHQRIPPNDGGISLGQAYVALARTPVIHSGAL